MEYNKQYYKDNRARLIENSKRYYQNNIEKIKLKKKLYRQTEEYKLKRKEYDKNNKKRLNEKRKIWIKNNHDKVIKYREKNYTIYYDKTTAHKKKYYNDNKNKILEKTRLRRLKYKEKWDARQLATKYILFDENSQCQICFSKYKLHRHHEDYSRPLDVIILCNSCHKKVHRKHNKLDLKKELRL